MNNPSLSAWQKTRHHISVVLFYVQQLLASPCPVSRLTCPCLLYPCPYPYTVLMLMLMLMSSCPCRIEKSYDNSVRVFECTSVQKPPSCLADLSPVSYNANTIYIYDYLYYYTENIDNYFSITQKILQIQFPLNAVIAFPRTQLLPEQN